MAQIKTTVRIEVIDARGESFIVERNLITDTQDNSRFWPAAARVELEAAGETSLSHLAHQYGKP